MKSKPLTVRTTLIMTAALAGGSATGTAAEALATGLDLTIPGVAHIVTAATALWIIDKLHALIDDSK